MLHVFDTNSLRVLGNYYPERFPSFWQRFDDVVERGLVLSVREVYNELKNQVTDDWYIDWIDVHKSMFGAPTAEEAKFVAEIFKVPHFRILVGEKQRLKGQPVADPFLIACARVRGGTVVSEEQEKPNAAKVPNVCRHFGVLCTNVAGFLKASGWRF
jgi:hypothetical protein